MASPERKMYPVKVSNSSAGEVLVTQEWNDINEPDPEIILSAAQARLVASWIFEAAAELADGSERKESIPVTFFGRGTESELEELRIYNNDSGMIIFSINENTFIEVSPAMAKRVREQLSKAISIAFADMLRGDEET